MEGIVAKRTLKKSYYNNKSVSDIGIESLIYKKTSADNKKIKTKIQKLKEKWLYKFCIQSITMISIILFILAIKLLKIDIVLESDMAKNIVNYYNHSYTKTEIIQEMKSLIKQSYIAMKPIIPRKVENKVNEIYKIVFFKDEKKQNEEIENKVNKEKVDNEVKIYEESGINNKENTSKENVGTSVANDEEEKVATVSSSVSSQNNILEEIKKTKIDFIKPVKGTITSHFGAREAIFEGIDSYHTGTDIAASSGTKVVSSIKGKVTRATYNKYNGNFVEVENGNISTIYCHMSKLSVKVGDSVKAGTKIGEVGSTGYSTGPHLHFEIVYNGLKIDPEMVLEL